VENQLDSAGKAKFLEDAAEVVPDGVFGDLELLGDLLVAYAFGNQSKHFAFAIKTSEYF